ncbi:putative DUF4365 domain-containing protein [Frankia sp. AiPs1]|uniref:DUF4365 domain-containing protein n=1 Tax=Frankia sp. AiPa1 TaxID=573492 RepID=UPI00202BA067|nr:DUF4365 domain-containing protein [Frankia sp. AiPa1]MCL9762636.1 DUF4365 domain-containing protein [Frankia sp. AiPa1]
MLDLDQRQGRYGEHLVQLIVTSAGYTCSKPDDTGDGVDLVVSRTQHDGDSPRPPNVEFQVKTIRNPTLAGGKLVYDLEVAHYNCLRADGPTRRYLALVTVPGQNPDDWHDHSQHYSIFRDAVFFVDLLGFPRTENRSRVRVKAALTDRLVPAVVDDFMRRAERDYSRRFRPIGWSRHA